MPLLLDPDSTEHSWWGGVRLPQVARTVALALALAAGAIAQSTVDLHQDEIPLSTQHAGFYETRPLYSVIRWEVDTSEQAFGLHGPPDDDQTNQRVLALSQANQYLQPWSVDSAIIPPLIHVEDEYWINPNEPILRVFNYPQPWIGEQYEQATGLFGVPDDDQTRQSVLARSQANVYPQPWADSADTQLYGTPDEFERWTNPNQPLIRTFVYPQPWLFDIQEPAGSLYGTPDENELWQNPLKPLVYPEAWIQQWPFDEQTPLLFGLPDENEVNQRVVSRSAANVYPQPWADNASVNLYGLPDDDQTWDNPLKLLSRVLLYPQPFSFEQHEIAVPALDDDQLVWRTLALRPWLTGRPEPWPHSGDTAPQQDYPPDIWINPNQPLVRLFVYPQQWTFDEQTPALYGMPDENELRLSVLALLPRANRYPQSFAFDTNSPFLFGPAIGEIDNDQWTNWLVPKLADRIAMGQWTIAARMFIVPIPTPTPPFPTIRRFYTTRLAEVVILDAFPEKG